MNQETDNFVQPNKKRKHEATVTISKDEFDRVNRLLAIESLENMTDIQLIEQGASTDHNEGIFFVTFDDGSSINFDLCSGQTNYWDDVVWTSPDGSYDVILECVYKLGDIKVEINSELYIVKLIICNNASEEFPDSTASRQKDDDIIAVDFDGTLCTDAWPKIGEPNRPVINYVKHRQKRGARLILWTNRVGTYLEEAVAWCAEQGIVLSAVNENLPDIIEAFGGDCRKIFANEYLDDRARLPEAIWNGAY